MKNTVMKLKGKTKAKISRNVLKLYLQVCKGAVKSLQNIIESMNDEELQNVDLPDIS